MDRVPPDPPDPPDPTNISERESFPIAMESSPPVFSQLGTKRRIEAPASPSVPQKKTLSNLTQSFVPTPNDSLFIHPSISDTQKAYSVLDKGPFIVHVSRNESSPSSGTTIRPIIFGQLLSKNKVKNIVNDGVKKIGRNRISVEFKSFKDANDFIINPLLDLYKYTSSIPNYNITRMGLIRGIPIELSMDELVESLSIPEHCGIVLKARRLNRKLVVEGNSSWIPSQTVVLTFKGQSLPEKIFSYYTSIPVESYLLPTIQCNNCCRFGHIKLQCRSNPRCYRCAQPHLGESCDVGEDKSTCLYCSGNHFAINKSCPEQLRQKSIKIKMSQDCISFQEASALFPSSRRSYADTSKSVMSHHSSVPQSYPSVPASSHSYKKTVALPPRPRPVSGRGYDREAHQAISGSLPSSLPNGCAFINSSESSEASPNEDCLDLLWLLVINILSKFSDVPLPPNVAPKIMPLLHLLTKNGPEHFTVEH